MLLEEGTHEFETKDASFDWASVSSPAPAIVRIFRDDKQHDLVYVHGPTHTWWSSNPLFCPPLRDEEKIKIVIEGKAAMRIECGGLKRVEA
jgi:hypothetical protein